MTVSTRLLLAASLCFAPLGWAAAQDQPPDPQHQRDHQDQHPQDQHQQQHGQQPPQQQHTPGNAAPQGQQHTGGSGQPSGGHPGGGAPGGGQHPAQNNTAPPSAPSVQHQTHAAPTPPTPPVGATAAPNPPSQGRFQGQPQHNNAAPAAATPQQQHAGQRGGGAPVGSAAPQAPSQQQSQPQQNNAARGNFQGNAHTTNTAAFSQHHYGAAPVQFDHGHFYGRDYAHFTVYDRNLWGRGAWHHEFRDGHYGWWYAVDGIWYFYAQPVYPYPTYIPDIVYIPEDDAPPPVYTDAPPPAPAPQYGQPPTYYYYFCPDSQTYYPYVNNCASSWQPVPAAPQPQ